MSQVGRLSQPPVQEAVVQFRFADGTLNREQLEALAKPYVDAEWKREERHSLEANIVIGETTDVMSSSTFQGFLLRSPDKPQAVQFHLNLVSVSLSRPYTCWEDLEELAFTAFGEYIAVARSEAVTQLSVRFINRIPGLEGLTRLEDILKRPPLTVDGLPDAAVTDFMRRHLIKGLEGGFVAALTVGTVQPEEGDFTDGRPLVVDSDVVKEGPLPPIPSMLKEELAAARNVKNALFFGSLHDAVVARFL